MFMAVVVGGCGEDSGGSADAGGTAGTSGAGDSGGTGGVGDTGGSDGTSGAGGTSGDGGTSDADGTGGVGDTGGSGGTSGAGGTSGVGHTGGSGGTSGAGGSGDALLPPSRSPIMAYCPFDDASDLTQFEGRPVIRVCHPGDTRAGCHVDTIAAAVSQSADGDRIEIVGGGAPYTECATIPDGLNDVEIIGVCGRPHIREVACGSKGAFVNYGGNLTLTNLEVSNVEISLAEGGNGAAIRDQGTGNLDLRYVYFHDNQNGILGGHGIIHIDWSRFEANGSSEDVGRAHNTYFSGDVDHVIIRNSIFLRARSEGNNMKSRAHRMDFHCSVSASLDGFDSREMDISEGGELRITNSIVQQGPESANSNLIGFATEATDLSLRHPVQLLVIQDSDIINDRGNGSFIAFNAFSGTAVELTNVRLIGAGASVDNINGGPADVAQTNVQELVDRAAAGLPAYSTDHMQLPLPPGCPDFEYF